MQRLFAGSVINSDSCWEMDLSIGSGFMICSTKLYSGSFLFHSSYNNASYITGTDESVCILIKHQILAIDLAKR